MQITPQLGIRVRLNAIAHGRWQNSGGEKSKFGLSAREVLKVIQTLREAKQLNCLTLLHCHMGSQIANIHDIQRGMLELTHYYTQLHELGAPITTIDIGGGLGIDYNGLATRDGCSVNYSLQEYANQIVLILKSACEKAKLPEPEIMSETGRGLVAHHAVLITNVIDIERPLSKNDISPALTTDTPDILQQLYFDKADLQKKSLPETYHHIRYWMEEAKNRYTHGTLSLTDLAQAEKLYLQACQRIKHALVPNKRSHRAIFDEVSNTLSDKFFINFSVFQSIPDVWAIDQLFPILPLTHLDKPQTHCATLHDITCDSDGCIKSYVVEDDIDATLPIIDLTQMTSPWLGIFLVGAYQEILGDMHNLFGDTHAINVEMDSQGHCHYGPPEKGDTISDVLRYVHIDLDTLKKQYKAQLDNLSDLSQAEKSRYLSELTNGLESYTYLEA